MKGIKPESVFINFRENAQRSAGYLAVNPAGLVPAMATDDGETIGQSLAILRYLDHLVPEPQLFPQEPLSEARALEMSLTIACDIHPLNNLRVLGYLEKELGHAKETRDRWYSHWVTAGFETLEALVSNHGGNYCLGDEITVADICLVPQMFNARRFKVPLDKFPALVAIDARLRQLESFRAAAPEN